MSTKTLSLAELELVKTAIDATRRLALSERMLSGPQMVRTAALIAAEKLDILTFFLATWEDTLRKETHVHADSTGKPDHADAPASRARMDTAK